jgi:RNA polymerase sigma factor (sigma-70 family)
MGTFADGEPDRSLLTPQEERDLALRIEAGVLAAAALASGHRPGDATAEELGQLVVEGEAARTRFTEANLGLVGMVSRQVAARSGVNQAELFQEAAVGLLVAVTRFDCRRGLRFATYALFWIRSYARAAAARVLGDLNLPTSRALELRAVRGAEAALQQSLGRTVSPEDVALVIGRTGSWVRELLAHAAPVSLTGFESESEIEHEQSAEHGIEAPERAWSTAGAGPSAAVPALLQELSGVQRSVLELRLGLVTGEPLSYAAVAVRLRLGVSRVRRVERAALERLRAVCPYDAAWTG